MNELPETIRVHFVPFDLPTTGNGSRPYWEMIEDREKAGIKMMEMDVSVRLTTKDKPVGPGPERDILLTTKYIFGDQWNAASDEHWPNGYRVHNFLSGIVSWNNGRPTNYRRGHYLVVTDEMREVCRLTHKCRYCGAVYFGLGWAGKFCDKCLDSEYLEVDKLSLLRLAPVCINGGFPEIPPLTPDEEAALKPAYIYAQTVAQGSRAVAKAQRTRQRVEEKYKKERDAVQAEFEGMLWLLDHHVNTDNVIFYSHTGVFCFGWRQPLSPDVKSALLDLLVEFPFQYELKETK